MTAFELTYYRGDTIPLTALITDDAGAALDLTGMSVDFTVNNPAGTPIWVKSIGSGISVLDYEGGKIAIQPTLPESQALRAFEKFPAKLIVTDAGGVIQTSAVGVLNAR